MTIRYIVLSVILCLFAIGSVVAEQSVSLDSVTSAWGFPTDSIASGTDIRFFLRVTNTPGTGDAYNPAFNWRIYSPDGATWQTTVLDTTGTLGMNQFDIVPFANWTTTGSGTDSVGVAMIRLSSLKDGLYDGYDDVAVEIQIHPQTESEGLTICLDTISPGITGGFTWMWGCLDGCEHVHADWHGPYCFRVVGQPTDSDGDGVSDLTDNCPTDYNPNQEDTDGDGAGDVCDNLTPNFTADPRIGSWPLQVAFADSSITANSIDSWYWDFGDGWTSGDQNPIHVYGSIGMYDVMLRITSGSETDSVVFEDFIEVVDSEPPDFRIDTVAPGDPFHLLVGDIDHDNYMDIIYVPMFTYGLYVLYGDGDLNFTSSGNLDSSARHGTPKLDFVDTTDTFLDIILVMPGGLQVFLNNGDGTFSQRSRTISSTTVPTAATGYFNPDAYLDVVYSPGFIVLGDGTGGFGAPISVGSFNVGGVNDFDNDGVDDILGIDMDSAVILRNNGGMSFTRTDAIYAGSIETSQSARQEIVDFDHDGNADFAVIHPGYGTDSSIITVGMGDGTGLISDTCQLLIEGVASCLVVSDVDRDHHLDLVASVASFPGRLEIFLGNGLGEFGAIQPVYWDTYLTYSLAKTDLDRDGNPDFISGNFDGSSGILAAINLLPDRDILIDEMTVTGYGNAVIGVENPDGYIISENFQTVAGADYWTLNADGDANLDCRSIDYNLEYGEYGVIIRLEPGYNPDEPLRAGIGINGSQQRVVAIGMGLFDLDKSGLQTTGDSVVFCYSHEEVSSIQPPNGLPTRHSRPVFDWSLLADPVAESYQFQLDRYFNFRAPIFDSSEIGQPLFITPTPLRGDSVYYWRFRSFDGAYWSDYSRTFAAYILDMECGIFNSGLTGNTNCSEDGKVTLSDITALIDRVYISKRPLCCEENGNANASVDGLLTLSDISRLIDHVYISRDPTEPCL